MFTAFPLAEVDIIVRRSVRTALALGVVVAVAAWAFGYPLAIPGLALGLGLAVANHRVFQASALRFTTPEGVVNRKPFAGSVAFRLGLCTAAAIVLLIVAEPVGWGVVGGLVLFQASMLLTALVRLLKYQRAQLDGSGSRDA